MATDITNAVTLSYNGYSFPATTETQSVSGTPIYDAAGRTVTHTVYSLTVRSVITVPYAPGNDVGDTVQDTIRKALTRPGGRLIYTDAGFGDFRINTGPAGNADVKWGPRPKVLNWKPLGNVQACEIVWQVEVAIAECDPAATGMPLGTRRPPLEYAYKLNYAIDQEGYTRRTYSGHVAVAQTRRSVTDATLVDHADRLREAISPRVPPRFRRTQQNYDLSEDKCKLSFSITDEQMPPNVPPPGVVSCTASHTVEAQSLALMKWNGTISADYTLAYALPRKACLEFFLALVRDRLEATRRAFLGQVQAGDLAGALRAPVQMGGLAIPTRLSLGEPEIYGRRSASFTLSYMVTLGKEGLGRAVELFGLFRPAPNTSWDAWHAAMIGPRGPSDPRGIAGLKFDPRDDRIIDLCLALDGNAPIHDNAVAGAGGGGVDPSKSGVARDLFARINGFGGEIRPEASWLDWRNSLRAEQGDNVAEAHLLPVEAVKLRTGGNGDGAREEGGGLQIPWQNAPAGLVQYRGRPSVYVVLEGRAARAAYGISPPTIEFIGGVRAIPANRPGIEFFRTEVATQSIYPICVATWRLRWLLPDVPTERLVAPPSPMAGAVATGSGTRQQVAYKVRG